MNIGTGDMTPKKSLLRRLASRVLRSLRAGAEASLQFLEDSVRAVVMVGLLRSAADFLPTRWALALARGSGYASMLLSRRGRRALRLMSQAFGNGSNEREIRNLAVEWIARPARDSVVLRSALRGRIDPSRWQVEERNAHLVDPLRQAGTPFIIASGHFSREANVSLISRSIIPATLALVANPPIVKTWHPRTRWLGYHYGQIIKYTQWARPDVQFYIPGTPKLFKTLIQHLRTPGHTLLILADAPWDTARGGSHVRPLAGRRSQAFATGTAQLSRLAQCPIAVCIPYLVGDGHVIIEWTRVIPPPPPDGGDGDARVIDLVLDDIENAIGRRPSQYVLDFLGKRHWDPNSERWQSGESPAE